jgi:hypothetical protein
MYDAWPDDYPPGPLPVHSLANVVITVWKRKQGNAAGKNSTFEEWRPADDC